MNGEITYFRTIISEGEDREVMDIFWGIEERGHVSIP
jgi:hypothetical protein